MNDKRVGSIMFPLGRLPSIHEYFQCDLQCTHTGYIWQKTQKKNLIPKNINAKFNMSLYTFYIIL